jgi:hypothetical protein
MTIEFEPNGVECNGVECDGALDTNVYIYPTFFAAAIFFNQLALVEDIYRSYSTCRKIRLHLRYPRICQRFLCPRPGAGVIKCS